MNKFFIVSKKTKSKHVTYLTRSMIGYIWESRRANSHRFYTYRQAYDFLLTNELEGKTIEKVDINKEHNIQWIGREVFYSYIKY